eukprot:gene3503-5041_t
MPKPQLRPHAPAIRRPPRAAAARSLAMSLAIQPEEFQHMIRVMNTNIDGKHKVPFAIRSIKGVGRRLGILPEGCDGSHAAMCGQRQPRPPARQRPPALGCVQPPYH